MTFTFPISVPAKKRVERFENGAHTITWEQDGTRAAEIVIHIDERRLGSFMGARAMRNGSRKATLANGIIRAQATHEVHLP